MHVRKPWSRFRLLAAALACVASVAMGAEESSPAKRGKKSKHPPAAEATKQPDSQPVLTQTQPASEAAPSPADEIKASQPSLGSQVAPSSSRLPVQFGLDLEYAGPYVRHGVRVTEGAVLQSRIWAAYRNAGLGDFRMGIFTNMYGSMKDNLRRNERGQGGIGDFTFTYHEGAGAKEPLEINEVRLQLLWNRELAKGFELSAGFDYLVYGTPFLTYTTKEHINNQGFLARSENDFQGYSWFGKGSNGEVSLRPSYRWQSLNFFAEANITVLSANWSIPEEADDPATPETDSIWHEFDDSWNQHYAIGATYAKEVVEGVSMDATLLGHLANEGFLSKWVTQGNGQPAKESGLFAINLEFGTNYRAARWLTLAPRVGTELITNQTVSTQKVSNNDLNIRGAFVYGSLKATFAW